MRWYTEGVVLAPMAGLSDSAFRTICRRFGATSTVTEMISAAGVCRRSSRTMDLIRHEADERPIGVQLFGANPDEMARAAEKLSSPATGFDFIDINAGCPVQKVVRRGAGAALLRDRILLEEILRSVARVSVLPVTLKTRLGWTEGQELPVDLVERLDQIGISALTIHGRYWSDSPSCPVKHDMIARYVQCSPVPVVANGDSRSLAAIDSLKERTGASGVMLGRGAARAPWIFSALSSPERRERLGDLPESGELLGIVSTQLDLLSRRLRDADRLYRLMRGKLVYYFHGFPGAADLRSRCARVESREEVLLLCELAEKQFDQLRRARMTGRTGEE